MERPICYQQLFVTIKVCRLMSCDFMTKLFKWAGVRPNHSSENELIHAWTAGFVNIWKIWIFRYIATWYIVIVVNVMVWSTNPILKRSPLRVLRPACACGNEFHRLHIWFIWTSSKSSKMRYFKAVKLQHTKLKNWHTDKTQYGKRRTENIEAGPS